MLQLGLDFKRVDRTEPPKCAREQPDAINKHWERNREQVCPLSSFCVVEGSTLGVRTTSQLPAVHAPTASTASACLCDTWFRGIAAREPAGLLQGH